MLLELRDHIKEKKSQSLLELSKHLNVTVDVLRDMLQLLVRKGQVRVCKKTPVCGTGCSKCSLTETEIYEWIT